MVNRGSSRIVVTVVGKDKVGIIAGVANVLAEYNANILDISQTILQDFFTMIMIHSKKLTSFLVFPLILCIHE